MCVWWGVGVGEGEITNLQSITAIICIYLVPTHVFTCLFDLSTWVPVLLLIQPLQPPTFFICPSPLDLLWLFKDAMHTSVFCSLLSPVHFEECLAHNRCSINICLKKGRMNEALNDYTTDVAKDYTWRESGTWHSRIIAYCSWKGI